MHHPPVCVRIRSDGSCTVDANNFPDSSCHQVTAEILKALAATQTREFDKPEARAMRSVERAQRESSR